MRKSAVVMGIGLCLLIAPASKGAETSDNSCVRCHSALPDSSFVGSRYASWATSIHAKDGITCDRCHGGDPSAAQEEAAHKDVYKSSNSLSRVYFKKVPATCGACHWREYSAFQKSAHYNMLEKKGAGPTCVTCHDSHSTRIVTPQEIPGLCRECHNERMHNDPQVPERAQALLLLVDETSALVQQAGKEAQAAGPARLESWKQVSQEMVTVRDGWHAFDLPRVQARLLEIYDSLKAFWGNKGNGEGKMQPLQP